MEGKANFIKGINYGYYSFDNGKLVCQKDNKVMLTVPADKITNSTVVNKQDIAMELMTDDPTDDDLLTEIRFYIPPNTKEDEMEDEKEGSMEDEKDADAKKKDSSAEVLNNIITANANITETSDNSIVTFEDLPFIVPRGKYSCDLGPSSLRMHGATFNHILSYKNINRAFLLPKPDEVHMFFVFGLEKPMRQGGTTHNYLVLQMRKDFVESIKVKLTKEQIDEQYGGKLNEQYDGPVYDIVAKCFKQIVKVNIIIPGDFKTSVGHNGVKCTVRASEGQLFFLTKSLIFVPKPVIYVKLDDIKIIEFHRLSQSAQVKLFDITAITKSGQKHNFSSIDKKELDIITDYFNKRKIPIKTVKDNLHIAHDDDDDDDVGGGRQPGQVDFGDDEDSEEDEDFEAPDDDDDDDDFDEDEDEDEDFEEEAEKKPKKK